jgi:hydroxymethylbilane synthase
MQTVRIGTRGSKLALYQAYRVKEELEARCKDIAFEIEIIKTKGDKILDVPLSKIGDKGLFTKELEVAMFKNEIDMAVHSLKDLPTTFPEGAKLGAVLKRGDVRDALISLNKRKLSDLTTDDVIATSSLRRKAQLLRINKDFKIVEIRGNVNTRIRKMEEGYCDVMVMAAAGLQRLEMGEYISELIDTDVMIPACSQGAIAIEIRENDAFIEEILSKINDTETMITTSAERAFLKTLEGGCQIPVGSYSYIKDGQFHITGFISDIDGQRFLKETAMAPVEQAVVISASMARKLYSLGGKEILESIRQYSMPQAQTNLPLQDKVIISTRAIETTDALPELLKAMGARVVSLPMIEIVMTQTSEEEKELFQQIDQFDWIFFTSKNGVANFFKQLIDVKGSTELARHIKKAVIGSKTAAELEYYGYAPDFMSKGNTSEEMLEQFYQEYQPNNQNILLALGKLADDTLIKRLSKENRVERINVYDTVKPQNADAMVLESITQDKYDLVVFTSPSTFHNLCSFYETDAISRLKMASIGGTTTKAIQEAGLEPLITARKSNVEGLCDAIIDYFKK